MALYTPVIGMEIHVELKTASKMFCSCRNGMGLEKEPNVHICPVCTAQPGTLPVPNREAITSVQRAGIALQCTLAQRSKFDRKNYFYPDLPKGYQISQYDQPLCQNGSVELTNNAAQQERIGITRIHLEEDTGKSLHPDGAHHSLVDLNRAGVPLMELVTEPDMSSGKQARQFCQKLQQIFRYIGISDADMEKGQMRCEVNISLAKEGAERLSGTKVEIKNLNSFRSVERAIDHEITRQTEALEEGGKIVQETRGWDDAKQMTIAQRIKESAHDYRYFPEPDIPPLTFTEEEFQELRRTMPELPDAKANRFQEQYSISRENLEVIIADKNLADYFEQIVSEIQEKIASGEAKTEEQKCVRLAANYLVSELQKYLTVEKRSIANVNITPENFAELMMITAQGSINSSATQAVLKEMYFSGGDPSHIIADKNLAQVSDEGALGKIINDVLAAHEKSVADYKAGTQNAFQYLIGQVMKATKGKANPKVVADILQKKLSS